MIAGSFLHKALAQNLDAAHKCEAKTIGFCHFAAPTPASTEQWGFVYNSFGHRCSAVSLPVRMSHHDEGKAFLRS